MGEVVVRRSRRDPAARRAPAVLHPGAPASLPGPPPPGEDISMRHCILRFAVLTAILLAFATTALAQTLKGPVSDKPIDEKWAPSKWGAQDRAGSANHTNNSANIARALATVKQNKAITIGKF